MKSNTTIASIAFILISLCIFTGLILRPKTSDLPLIAIANYGPHPSLEASIVGIKQSLASQGFIENKTVLYKIADVGFDPALIPQMISQLKNQKPHVLVVITTPVAQFAKGAVRDIPLVYTNITDPVEAGLTVGNNAKAKLIGASDRQDLNALLSFVHKLLPKAHKIGMLYASSEANDVALVKMMQKAAALHHMDVVALPVHQARDVPLVMQQFKGKIDLLYVGASGPIQPTLPVIAKHCQNMNIPLFNVHEEAVKKGLALASFGVNYEKVGHNTGVLVGQLLQGKTVNELQPSYPTIDDHHGYINALKAKAFGIEIPAHYDNIAIVESE